MDLKQLLEEIDEFLHLKIKEDHICTTKMQLSFTILQKARDTLFILSEENQLLRNDNIRLRHFLKQ